MTTLTVLTGPLDHMASPQPTYLLTTTNSLSNNQQQQQHQQHQSSSSSEDSHQSAKPAKRSRPEGTRRRASRPAAAPAVARRNERERNRVRQVNLGFATLRQHVPAKSKKMSKVETLRSAVQYIKQLQQLLRDENGGGCSPQPHQPPSSPEPSLGSDASSPYDSLSPEDEELLDFTTWLS